VQGALRLDATTGSDRLAEDVTLAVPSAVYWSRRLRGGDLVEAEDSSAQAALDRVSRLQTAWFPSDPSGFVNRSRAELVGDRLVESLAALNEALVRDPTSPYLHRLRGALMRESGDVDGFLDHLAQAEAIAPSFNSPPIELLSEDRRWVRTEGIRRRVNLYPSQRTSNLLALATELRRQGDFEGASEVLGPVEGDPEVQIRMASWDLEVGMASRAIERVQGVAARRTMPTAIRVRALSVLAQARDAMGDSEAAVEAAEMALELSPGATAPYLALARMAERRKDYGTALEHLRKAWGLDPANVGLLLRFASIAQRAEMPADAKMALERAVELAPDRPEVAARLVEFHLRRGEYMDATFRLSDYLERFPTDPRLLRQAERLRKAVSGF
jgi:tetratricopeptide (TPR) repeat protein